jgi:GT2 family glycosyltransferase
MNVDPSGGPPRLTLCVVNFNGESYVDAALRSAFAQGPLVDEILLVDNASQDRSVERVESRFPEVGIVRLAGNRGPGAARNAGHRAARHDRILFMDNDVVLTPGCAALLAGGLDQMPGAVAAMPRVVFADRPETVQFEGADAHYLGLMVLKGANAPAHALPDCTRRMNSLVTACFLLDRRLWGEEDLFDESFFFNYEDHDFGMRSRVRGYEVVSVPSAVCLHGSGTPGLSLRTGREYSSQRVVCLIRNRWQILLKNYQLRSLLVLSPMLVLYEMAQLVEVVWMGWVLEWLTALRWMAGHAAEIRKKRRGVQRARRSPDREILCGGPLPFREELTRGRAERGGRALLDWAARGYWSLAMRVL